MTDFVYTLQLSQTSLNDWKLNKLWINSNIILNFEILLNQTRDWYTSEIEIIQNTPLWIDRKVKVEDFEILGKKLFNEYKKIEDLKPEKIEL